MEIPEPVKHVDCPKCAAGIVCQIATEGKTTDPHCPVCGGEGVVRADGEQTLKTRLENYIRPQIKLGMRAEKSIGG